MKTLNLSEDVEIQSPLKKRHLQPEPEMQSAVYRLPVADIIPNRHQPRKRFGEGAIRRLADSILEYGIMQPITVRKVMLPQEGKTGFAAKYELISGERRLRAAVLAGFSDIPAILVNTDEETSAELALVENLLREDLNCFEQAEAFEQLIQKFHLTQEEAARRVSMTQAAVANKLRLLALAPEDRAFICEHELSERHARAILKLQDSGTRRSALQAIVAGRLNVSETEKMIDGILAGTRREQTGDFPAHKRQRSRRVSADAQSHFFGSIRNAVSFARSAGLSVALDSSENADEWIVHIVLRK